MSSERPINYASDRKYAPTHEWVKMDGALAIIGLSDYAQNALGDVVFVELPAVGAKLEQGKSFGVVESVKAASDIYAPISGVVDSTNDAVNSSPDLVNRDALGEGWLIKIRPSNLADLDSLMAATTYQKKIEAGEIH